MRVFASWLAVSLVNMAFAFVTITFYWSSVAWITVASPIFIIALKVLQLIATQHLSAFQETARVGKGWQGLQACRERGIA